MKFKRGAESSCHSSSNLMEPIAFHGRCWEGSPRGPGVGVHVENVTERHFKYTEGHPEYDHHLFSATFGNLNNKLVLKLMRQRERQPQFCRRPHSKTFSMACIRLPALLPQGFCRIIVHTQIICTKTCQTSSKQKHQVLPLHRLRNGGTWVGFLVFGHNLCGHNPWVGFWVPI